MGSSRGLLSCRVRVSGGCQAHYTARLEIEGPPGWGQARVRLDNSGFLFRTSKGPLPDREVWIRREEAESLVLELSGALEELEPNPAPSLAGWEVEVEISPHRGGPARRWRAREAEVRVEPLLELLRGFVLRWCGEGEGGPGG